MPVSQYVPSGVYGQSIHLPRWVDNIELDDASAQSYTVPTGAVYALIVADADIYIRVAATASVPTADVVDGTGSFLLKAGIQCRVESGVAISMIRSGGSTVIISIGCYLA